MTENEILKGVFHGSAHVPAYQLYPFKSPHSHALLDTSVITYYNNSPSKTTNDQNPHKISTDYTLTFEYQNKLPE